jgi:nucleotidyltransferase/DNA polymerase involved in DNA repair
LFATILRPLGQQKLQPLVHFYRRVHIVKKYDILKREKLKTYSIDAMFLDVVSKYGFVGLRLTNSNSKTVLESPKF